MIRRTTIIRVLGVLLAALFLSHYAGATLFVHTHNTAEGSVTHSHPYLPSSTHGHSTAGFAAIDALTTLWFCVAATVGVAVWLAYTTIRRIEKSSPTRAARFEEIALRGPPAVC